jgi:hypothetical protein
MEKIDFFGGTHGNFLELLINLFIYQIDVDQTKFFNKNGSCHLKNENPLYIPKIKCNHYSYFNIPLNHDDLVIEIHCSDDFMLPAIVNSLVRAGDEVIDISNLENNTIKKLFLLPKATELLKDIIKTYGEHENYPRSTIRNYFYSKFDVPEYGIDLFNNFNHTEKKLIFPFGAFFDYEELCLNLNKCAFFLGMNFYPTDATYNIWKEFIRVNQGYQSYQKCKDAMHYILSEQSMDISNFNIVEEAWLLYRISRIFRCFNHPAMNIDQFVVNTVELSQITYQWKKGDYPSRPKF